MYEREKALARIDFVMRFTWNNEDGVLLRKRVSDTRMCMCTADCQEPAAVTLHDIEDDVSGGFPLCEEHASEWVFESGPPEAWVSQNAAEAWEGPNGQGWKGLWFLFAPEGRYASALSENPGEWPYEEDPQEAHERQQEEERSKMCLRSRIVGPRHDETGLECDLPSGHEGEHSAVFVDDYRITWKG